jgi:hypothetical protein
MYTFNIGSKFILHGVKWDDERKEYVYDESIIASEYLEKDDESIITNENINKEDCHMRFDVKKVHELLYDSKFHIQDHDNKFQFYGILKFIEPDKLTFYITGPFDESECRGTYTFPAGSKFTLHKLRLDADKKEWIYTRDIIGWKDITETDDDTEEEMKEENNMVEEEKNTTEWLPCVVSDGTWTVNSFVNVGDHIYRIFNDKIDIKANMIIKSLGWSKINLHLTDIDTDILNIAVDEKLRVCQTSSENDPGTLVMKRKLDFNKELRSGGLYRIIDSSLNLQYLMYIKCYHGGYIDADIMHVIRGEECSKIKIENEQLSLIDLKDMMFNRIYFTEGCHLNLE